MKEIMPDALLSKIFYAALNAVNPYTSVKAYCDKIRASYQQGNYSRLIIIGFGKASYSMARAVEEQLGDLIDTGIIITKYGHSGPNKLDKIIVIEAGHPLPDENGFDGAKQIINLIKDADEKTLTVCLISGGGSALLVFPYEGISLIEKQTITRQLLNAGADIYELNAVRKHISAVKGGRLAEFAYPSKVISLILSDVIGDRLDVIASGPTSYDQTTYNDALEVLKKYSLLETVPLSIADVIDKGIRSLIPETPKEDNTVFEKVENIIVGSNKKAVEAAKHEADKSGYPAEIISSKISGEAHEVGKWLAKKAIELMDFKASESSFCFISGGETTVTVRGNGIGGRNMELALSFALEIEGIEGIELLSAGTDGTDGPTDAAGAIVNGQTIVRAKALGLVPEEYLKNNDSYSFFKKIGSLFMTGPTGTNVMDIQITLIE